MAYSEDTQAIIDRLKAEGDLIRNSGTNSVKSLNIKLEKFDGLFQSINTNIIEQTSMLQKQMGITVDAAERLRSKEQFDEVTPAPTANQTDDYDKSKGSSKADTDKAINRIGDDIAKAFSFKNLLLAAGAGFVGFNFIKGFVDEFGGIKPLLQELGVPESTFTSMESLGTTFTEMKTSLEGLTGPEGSITAMSKSLKDIGTTLTSLNTKFETILNMNWTTIASVALGALSAFGVACAALRLKLTDMRLELKRGTAMQNGRTWWQRALGVNKSGGPPINAPVRNVPVYNPDGTVKGPGQSARPGAMVPEPIRAPVVKPSGQPLRTPMGVNLDDAASRTQLRVDAAGQRKGALSMRGNRLVNATGQFVSDADALKIMESTLDPKYSKIFSRIMWLFKKVAIVFAITMVWQVWSILMSDMTDDQKIEALAPILGSIAGAVGGAAIGAAIATATVVGAGWGTLILGAAGGIAGAFAGEALGRMIAKWAFNVEPTAQELMSLSVQPRPLSNGGRNNLQGKWDTKYGETHNADGSPMINGITPVIQPLSSSSSGPNTRGSRKARRDAKNDAAETMPTAIFDADGRLIIYDEFGNPRSLNNIEMKGPLGDLLRSDAGGAGGGVAMASVAPVVAPTYIMQGGSEVKQITFKSGNSMNGGSLLPYGMTSNFA